MVPFAYCGHFTQRDLSTCVVITKTTTEVAITAWLICVISAAKTSLFLNLVEILVFNTLMFNRSMHSYCARMLCGRAEIQNTSNRTRSSCQSCDTFRHSFTRYTNKQILPLARVSIYLTKVTALLPSRLHLQGHARMLSLVLFKNKNYERCPRQGNSDI